MKINGNPDGGGGGGVITGLTAISNGIYTAGGGVDGYSPVEVNVQPSLQDMTITVNGSYTADQGYYGLNTVTVNVPDVPPVTSSLEVTVNGVYTPGTGVDGFSQVTVDVPQSVEGFTFKNILENTYDTSIVYDSTVSSVYQQMFNSVSTVRILDLPNCRFVGTGAFTNCGFNTISLPKCSRIANNAFDSCTYINSLYLPICESIGGFYRCYWLTYLDLPKVKEIYANTFKENIRLSQVSLPICERIGYYAFESCSLLEKVDLPECSYIDNNAFQNCSVLSQVNINRCESVRGNVLQNCPSLTEVSINIGCYLIPSGSTYMFYGTPLSRGSGSIYVDAANYDRWIVAPYWSSLSNVMVSVGTTDPLLSFSDGLVYGKTNILLSNFSTYLGVSKNSVTSINLSQCELISRYGVNGYSLLTNITLPECLYVGPYAFQNCYSLSSIELPKCSYIGEKAFSTCSSLSFIELPKCSYIGASAFQGCSILSTVSLPECTYIDNNAFNWLPQLATVYLPGSSFCSIWTSDVFAQWAGQSVKVSFFVNSSLLDTYKNDSKWSWYSSRIFPIE